MSQISKIAAGGTRYTTVCQGGGDKKAGLAPSATSQMLSMPFNWRAALGGIATPGNGRAKGTLNTKFKISTVNQIGGVGRLRSQTSVPTADGVNLANIKTRLRDCLKTVNSNDFRNYKIVNRNRLSNH